MSNVVSFEQIQQANDIKFKEIPTPEWGGEGAVFRIGSLNAGDMIEWVETNEGPAKRTAGLRLMIKSAVDENGNRTGTDKHLEMLRTRNQEVCGRVIEAILDFNGLSSKKAEETKNA